jgi:hypothetical protein
MQTTIPRSGQPRAIAGMIADNRAVDLVSAFSGEASAVIPFGFGLINAGTERVFKLPSGGGDKFAGISVWDMAHQPDTGGFDLVSGAAGGIKPKGGFELCREGRIWVVVDGSIVTITPYTDRGFLRHTANGAGTIVGSFLNAADGGNTIDLSKLVQFVSPLTTAADGVTKIALIEVEAIVKP